MGNEALRELPGIEKLVSSPSLKEWDDKLLHSIRVKLAQEVVGRLRERILKGEKCPPVPEVEKLLAAKYEALVSSGMRKVINATGVVLHTNLGRAPLGRETLSAMADELGGYATLEFDAESGERGSRTAVVERLLTLLTDAPAGIAVNNNAAAVFLILHALSRGKGALISRGELVQIGGGFRVPDILAASGTQLVEVGTTNMTSLKDYEAKLAPPHDIALILKVHQSNFVILGHTESPSVQKLSEVAKKGGIPLAVDIGSGALVDEGVDEPTVQSCLKSGADLVCFSGDKLLGGPQAGLIVGDAALVDKCRKSPLYRALRLGKTELFTLEKTLLGYVQGKTSPTQAFLRAGEPELKARAESLRSRIAGRFPDARVIEGTSSIGGGTTPGVELKTWLVEISPAEPEATVRKLLKRRPAVVVRKENKKILLDPRTVFSGEEAILVQALTEVG